MRRGGRRWWNIRSFVGLLGSRDGIGAQDPQKAMVAPALHPVGL